MVAHMRKIEKPKVPRDGGHSGGSNCRIKLRSRGNALAYDFLKGAERSECRQEGSNIMAHVLDTLKERGFLQQSTDESDLRSYLSEPGATCYLGFDPTAGSLHIGSLVPIMALKHLQNAGLRTVALLGGGTAMVGDPSGKTEMRRMLQPEDILENAEAFKVQLSRYLAFDGEKSLSVNNLDWLGDLNYITFLREIGRHFSVNRMLTAEAYRMRLESGLSFIEFNYQLLQAYDYLMLFRELGCRLQIGGDDQWGNCLAGKELIRRVESEDVHVMTFPLLTTASGAKMGKTASGAVWLDAERTSPYDFYQYWINVDDRDVQRFLALFTFLPMDEVHRLASLEGSRIREAKEVLAFEVTRISHGEEEADKARSAARSLFGGSSAEADSMPETRITRDELADGLAAPELLVLTGLAKSRSEGRRLIQQGGVHLGDRKCEDVDEQVRDEHFSEDGVLLIRVGKKRFHRMVIE
jgi:tyrosyl-tRNA synthetase